MTRDKEIEALAMRIYESRLQAPTTAQWRGVYAADAFDEARAFFDMRDLRFSSTRPPSPNPPAPALPTDRMGWLELWLRCCHALDLDGSTYNVKEGVVYLLAPSSLSSLSRPHLTPAEFTRIQALAAELTAKEGRDG